MTSRSTDDTPELSVVIAAYNAAETLGVQLAALTAEPTGFPFEILVCDNGSTDGTADLVEAFRSPVATVRLIDASARRGPAAARNIGAESARAPLLAFCDADDEVAPTWVIGMRDAVATHGFVAGSFEFDKLNEGAELVGLWTAQSSGLTRKSFLPAFQVAGAGNMGIRADAFARVGGFYEGLRTAEDDDLCLRVQLSGQPLVFVPELVLHVRRRGGLRQLCRQAFAYAAGEKRIAYRYAAFVDAEMTGHQPAALEDPAAAPSDEPRQSVPSLVRRAMRKLLRVRQPADLAAVAWRWSWRLGWRRTHDDPSIPRIDPDDPATLVALR